MSKQIEQHRYTKSQIKGIMQSIADEHGIELVYLKVNQGWGGYNYAASAGDSISIAPFISGKKGNVVKGYELYADCNNPLECMFISFFHEFAHCRLTENVPSQLRGFSWNDTSKFQFELWITMLGIEFAHKEHGIKFSDQSVKWLLEENMTYIKNDWKDFGNGVVTKSANSNSYTILGLPKEVFSD